MGDDNFFRAIDQTGKSISKLIKLFKNFECEDLKIFEDGYIERIFLNGTFEIWISEFRKGSKLNPKNLNIEPRIISCIFGSLLVKSGDEEITITHMDTKVKKDGNFEIEFLEDSKFVIIADPQNNKEKIADE